MNALADTQGKIAVANVVGWAFAILFSVIGVLNLVLVHPVPGIFYLVLAAVYFPGTDRLVRTKFGFAVPLSVKIIIGLAVLWGTLAVGDLAEMAGL